MWRADTSMVLALVMTVAVASMVAQHGYSPAEVAEGGRLFQSSCARCHGADGDAAAGVNFGRGQFRRAATDDDIARIITVGIPGTGMPPGNFSEFDAGRIVAYLRSMTAAPEASAGGPGDAARGKTVVEGKGQCLTPMTGLKRGIAGAALVASAAAFGTSWATVIAQVSFDRLLRAAEEPQNWLTYSGTTMSQRYSLLTQVTAANVKNLEQQWVFQAQSLEKFEATPLVVDGVIYTVQAPNDVVALDAVTGRAFWIYSHVPSPQARPCCGRVNRGLAILGNTLFMATLDDHLIALDARSGRLVWNVTIEGARPEAGYAFTVAPLVVKNKIIVGVAGAEFGVRGFLAAFDATTGREV